MAKDDYITLEGSVVDVLPGNQYRVKLHSNDHIILAYLGGKMKKNRIRVIEGDRVDVEISAYDVSKGRISYRYK